MKKLIFLSLMFIACEFNSQLNFDENLEAKIIKKYKKDYMPVELVKLTNFNWDSYIIIGPYQNLDRIENEYDLDLSNISEYATSDDSKNYLIFIKNKKSIRICKIPGQIKFSENKLLVAGNSGK